MDRLLERKKQTHQANTRHPKHGDAIQGSLVLFLSKAQKSFSFARQKQNHQQMESPFLIPLHQGLIEMWAAIEVWNQARTCVKSSKCP